MNKVIGIDISKQTFDVSLLNENGKWKHFSFRNNLTGFKKLVSKINKDVVLVMEASGPYYMPLAVFLHQNDYRVSVVNPLIIRRFSQMQMNRAKTDKKDAKVIAQYGLQMLIQDALRLWEPPAKVILQMRQMQTTIEGYIKEITMLSNRMEALQSSGAACEDCLASIKQVITILRNEIKKLEKRMEVLACENYPTTMKLLKSIPGIGQKTAIALIVLTNNFENFTHYKQLIAYIGLSPRVFESGTSVKGKGRICKLGNARMRKLLYLCSLAAKRYNKGGREMYERLKAKGKPERVIKIAIANKLVKQAFAIVKSGKPYDENYVPVAMM